jgi:hypothetical protein
MCYCAGQTVAYSTGIVDGWREENALLCGANSCLQYRYCGWLERRECVTVRGKQLLTVEVLWSSDMASHPVPLGYTVL